jgi:hypothetical protein
MSCRKTYRVVALLIFGSILMSTEAFAQQDSTENVIDSFLLNRKGLLGKLARSLMSNSVSETAPLRNDLLYRRYNGRIVRNIIVRRLDFGTPINDTSSHFRNVLTRFANTLHTKTKEDVIRNNLFFKRGDKLSPALFSDNERHLRDLPFLYDAKITVLRVNRDSVDILVQTKDVFSIGGSYRMHSTTRMSIAVSEDNLAGLGHELLFRSMFDNTRQPKFGFGAEYTARNIKGSFVDWYGGYTSFGKNFNTGRQNEELSYTGFIRPLVNPYMKFTYAAEAAWHNTDDVFPKDTNYLTHHKYRYSNYDAWIGWNTGAFKIFSTKNEDNRLRTLVGLRWLQQEFNDVPSRYADQYYFQYADLGAVLAAVTVFKQDFYKASYVYGLGRTEDIPEGLDITFTTGWTKKDGRERPYAGIDIQRYFFTTREHYFNYVLKADAFFHKKKVEDANLLFNVDYFSRLFRLGKRWKQRNFVTLGVAHQPKRLLNEPLFLQSDFGLREWRRDSALMGDTRLTIKAESIFFTPWLIANFRFAPFVFTNFSLFNAVPETTPEKHLFTTLGSGVRIRNESLVFETMEFRAYFFPSKNFIGDYFRLEFNTRVRFKYNRQFIKKPTLLNVNNM